MFVDLGEIKSRNILEIFISTAHCAFDMDERQALARSLLPVFTDSRTVQKLETLVKIHLNCGISSRHKWYREK